MSRLETVISSKNSTTGALGSGATFDGSIDDLSSFQEIDINLKGSPSSASGILTFEFSPDGVNWDISISLPLYGPRMPPLPLRIILPKFRVRYVNGPTALTEFRLTTVLHKTSSKPLTRFLNQPLSEAEPVEVVRAILTAQKPDDSFVLFQLTEDEEVPIFASALPLPTGASTEATLAAIKAKTDNLDVALSTRTKPADQQHVLVDNLPSSQAVTGPLTDAQLRAAAVPVSGTVAISNFPATQPVSGPLTDVQLRAAAVPVSASSLPLPSGAATETTLAAIKAKTDNIDVALSTRTKPGDNQNVLVTNWPAELGGGISKTLYDMDDPTVAYIGTASQGAASSASAWLIKRILFDGSGNPLSTTWTANTAVWDNRSSETYT